MFGILGLAAIACIVALLEAPMLYRQGYTRDAALFFILLALAFIMSSVQSLGLPLPNPSDWIAWLFKPLTDLLSGWLF